MNKKQFVRASMNLIRPTTVTALVLLVVGLMVSSAVASNVSSESNNIRFEAQGVGLLSHGGSTDGCMVERYNATKPANVTSLNCTSNDVLLAEYSLISGPSSCIEGEDITVTLLGKFIATSSERWDVGVFVATDGGDPNSLGGSCYNDFLHPISIDNSDLDLIGGLGPFYNGEITEDPLDACGDIQQGQDSFFQTAQITITCQDSDDNGIADVNSCTVWANSRSDGSDNKPSCTDELDTTAETSAKCTCGNVEIADLKVPQDGTIEIIKDVEPDEDSGLFNLQLDGQTQFANAADGDTTGPVKVSAGFSTDTPPIGDTHTVGETAGNGTNLDLYSKVIFCEDQESDTASAIDAGPLDVFVEPGDAWVCTITNTLLVTDTDTPTPTDTATPTNTATNTATPTDTATPTSTSTNTATPTGTGSPTVIPTDTDTPTPTATSTTVTLTPTEPGTPRPTVPTITPTPGTPSPPILIPVTGADRSLSTQTSGSSIWLFIYLGLGLLGSGMIFHRVVIRLMRNR